MDYNQRAVLIAEAVNPAYLPWDVLHAQTGDQNAWDGEPVTEFGEGDRVWHQPNLGRGWYALVLGQDPRGVTVLPERDGAAATVPTSTLTLLRRA